MQVRINTIENKWDNAVVPLETTWDTFRAVILQGHEVALDKESAKLFNACEYRSAETIGADANLRVFSMETAQWCARRLADNVLTVTMLILDYDGGLSLEAAKERFRDFEYVAYTSFSHHAEPGQDRFRVVFPLISPIPASGLYSAFDSLIHGSAWHELQEALQEFAGPCDPVSFRCNQFYYLPLVNEARKPVAQVWSNAGKLLDWTTWKRAAPPVYTGKADEAMQSSRYLDEGLGPDQMLRTQSGYIRVRDVVGRVEGVWCPYHDDHNGSEFARRVPGGVFLHCRKCRRSYWMVRVSVPENNAGPLLTMDGGSEHSRFVDASDRTQVSKQLERIGRKIVENRSSRHSSHFVYLPEGSGKSRLAFNLAVSGHRIFFACKSMDQVFEKYNWFTAQAREYAEEKTKQQQVREVTVADGEKSPPVQPINVQLFLSKGAKARRRFGVDVVRAALTNPFDTGDIDDEASIQGFIAANPTLSEAFIRLSWRFFGPDKLGFDTGGSREAQDEDTSGPARYESADIIVTTFAQARLLRLRNQSLPPDWTAWFDDPDVSDFADIEPYTPEVWGELTDEEKRESRIITRESGRMYFKRDLSQSLGAAVSRLRCVYTTTEQVTMRAGKELLRRRGEKVRIHNRMQEVMGGKITLLGTQYVYSSYDGIIPLMVRRLTKEGHDVTLIADGLGQSLNHSNSKGKNDLTRQNLIVEVSAPHPVAVQTICDAMGVGFRTEGKVISRDMVMDQLHQALGRNSGYRFAGYECVALIPANLHAAVIEQTRYAFDEQNSVMIDRTASMGRKDRRTKAASALVLAVEDFLNNFDVYIQDGRKVLPDIKAVIGGIEDAGDRMAYAARLLHALTTISGITFHGTPTATDMGHRLYSKYRDAVDAVLDQFPMPSAKERVIAAYRARLETKTKVSQKSAEKEVSLN